jgi:hypothetical protein
MKIDNKWVVPYHLLRSRIFEAHTNVAYRNSVKSICKCINEGNEQAMFGLERDGTAIDEVQRQVSGRYIIINEGS